MITLKTSTEEDQLLLTFACGLKHIPVSHEEGAAPGKPVLAWKGGQADGAAAALLVTEASVPNPSLFPNGNIGMPLALLHWRSTMMNTDPVETDIILSNAELVARQMADGRDFLQGREPGLADICSASWLIPRRDVLPSGHPLVSWLDRMNRLEQPEITNLSRIGPARRDLDDLQQQGLLMVTNAHSKILITSPLDH